MIFAGEPQIMGKQTLTIPTKKMAATMNIRNILFLSQQGSLTGGS